MALRVTAGLGVVCALACNAVTGVGDFEFGVPTGMGGTSSAGSGGIGASAGATAGGAGGGTGASGGAASQWFDSSFGYRRKLTIDNSSGSESLVDFPLFIAIDDTRIDYGRVRSDARDLRFVDDDDATVLDYEIERWDPDGISLAWIEVPTIPASSSNRFVWMYYDSPTAVDAQDPAGTWSNGYMAVWHMDPALTDSTGGGHDGTSTDTSDTPITIGQAHEFNGTTSYVDIPQTAGLHDLFATGGTVTAWIFPRSAGENDRGRIVDISTSTSFANGWGLMVNDPGEPDQLYFGRGFSGEPGRWSTPAGSISLDEWHHVAAVFDDRGPTSGSMFIDGVSQAITVRVVPVGTPQSDVGSSMRLGNAATEASRTFDGYIAEVRLATVARSAEWVAAQFRSSLDMMISFGPEEARP